MGSLLHLLEVNEDSVEAKTFTNKSQLDGFEAPRNSLELPFETNYGLYNGRENILYGYHVTKESSENNCGSTNAPIKNLMGEEISDSLSNDVALLMGFDTLPCDSEPTLQPIEVMNETPEKKNSEKGLLDCSPQPLDYGSCDHKRREHPQEEELQKFKKEFEAWQVSRFKESLKIVGFSSCPSQLLAQENLNRENEILCSGNREKEHEHVLDGMNESLHSNVKSRTDYLTSQLGNSWNSTPNSNLDKRGSIENFLQEVKERLDCEMQGKSCKRSTSFRGGGIETPFREKPSSPSKARHIKKDLEMSLLRSESTRSSKSDSQLNGTSSSELFDKVTRRFLTERLRNVLKGDIHRKVPMVSCSSPRSSLIDYEKVRDGQTKYLGIENYPKIIALDLEKKNMLHEEMSSANLIRSLSAPVSVSRTSFRNLLENHTALAGEQILKKQEVSEKVSMNEKKQRKDKFNIREKVSSFKYNLTHRGKLFRRLVQSVEGSHRNKHGVLRDISSGPTSIMHFYDAYENFTEVPPSPASVCSSVHEEFWMSSGYSSPTSPSSLRKLKDIKMPQFFRETNSNLNDAVTQKHRYEVEIVKEDPTEAYIRDLLVASGLYYGSCDRYLLQWDPLDDPISKQVFEVVEVSYEQSKKDDGENLNHKMLLDLLNEALLSILKPKKGLGTAQMHSRGKKLLTRVWEVIKIYIHPPVDRFYYALNNMLARDFEFNPWFAPRDDHDINDLGRDIEWLVIEELIDDIVEDMQGYLLLPYGNIMCE